MESRTGPVVIVLLAVRFVLELCLLAAFCVWGFTAPDGIALQLLLGIGAPVVTAAVWGVFVSPKATVSLPLQARLAIELVLFALAAACLVSIGHVGAAIALLVVEVVAVVLLAALGRPPGT